MRCVDVNVLVYALHEEADQYEAYSSRLTELANGNEPLGIPDVVASGFVRLVTNHRIFESAATPRRAWAELDRLLAANASRILRPGVNHWQRFRELSDEINARVNDVSDAFIAAYAVENNATLLSADRGFRRFDGVSWKHPLDS